MRSTLQGKKLLLEERTEKGAIVVVVVVVLLFNDHGKHLRSCRDGQLTTLFLGRLRPP